MIRALLVACAACACTARPAPSAPARLAFPPFVDSHVHLSFLRVAEEHAARGVAVAIDLGAPLASLAEPPPSRPRLLRSGPMLTAPGGYPLESWGADGYGLGCADGAEAAAAVDRLRAAGARVIKIVLQGERGLSDEAAAAAITRAHALGLRVAAHALGAEDARRAAALGVDVLAHTPTEPLPDDVVRALSSRAVISTLAAFGGTPAAVDNLRRLRAAGATVLYGTDLGNSRTPGVDPAEIALLRAAGLDDAAIVAAGTTAPTRFWALDAGPGQALVHAAAAARDRLGRELAAQAIPGLGAAVVVGDEVVFAEGFGFADLDRRLPVTAETRFRLASISKVITAAALARLVDAGKLELDTAAGSLLPALPAPLRPITARQLAGHLGGIRHYQLKDFGVGRRAPFSTVSESLSVFAGDPLVAPPGTTYAYSTFGFTLLAAMLEKASGEPFLPLVQHQVAEPLGLGSLAPDDGRADPLRTIFYAPGPVVAQRQDLSARWAGAGFLATPTEVARFGAAHRAPGYLSAATLKVLFAPQRTAEGKDTGVGLAWRVAVDAQGRRVVHHEGDMAGARSTLVVYPEHGVSVAIMTNVARVPADIYALGLEIAALFLAR